MALEQFLELTGVLGEASAPDARGSIPILSWSMSMSGTGDAPSFEEFRFVKAADSSTPPLMALCAQGRPVAQAKLLVRSTGHRDPRLVVDLREVTIVSMRTDFLRESGELLDQVTLRFERLWVGGAVLDRRGVGESVNWFSWDIPAEGPATA